MSTPLLQTNSDGLWCEYGQFYIDPWAPVDRALITHGHSDHARRGSQRYLCAAPGAGVLRSRLGEDIALETLRYGESLRIGDVTVSFHPAGHVLGSAQIRVERTGEVWVASGDYKVVADPTATPFEPVRCHTFITESTFGLPIYRWPAQADVVAEIHAWWRANRAAGKCSVIFAYPLGKSQRVFAALDASIGPIHCHGAPEKLNQVYREAGIALPQNVIPDDWSKALVIAPPSTQGSAWMKKFGNVSTAIASGWMRLRGPRRRQSVDRGFVLSDHADWPGLLSAIEATGATTILPTHGYTAPLARWCRDRGLDAHPLQTQFTGDGSAEEIGEAE